MQEKGRPSESTVHGKGIVKAARTIVDMPSPHLPYETEKKNTRKPYVDEVHNRHIILNGWLSN